MPMSTPGGRTSLALTYPKLSKSSVHDSVSFNAHDDAVANDEVEAQVETRVE